MKKYGLIGFPVSHSFSKAHFEQKFREEKLTDHSYSLFPLENIKELRRLIDAEPELEGLNVTLPHKQSVLAYADEVHPVAERCGAANTLKIEREGKKLKIIAFNSDYYGFKNTLTAWLEGKKIPALVLGNGGAARAVRVALEDLNIPFLTVHREKTANGMLYQELNKRLTDNYPLLVQTTPLGMFPHTDESPEIPCEHIGPENYLYDLVYNPAETRFLKEGKKRGARIKNGLEMLHLQAEISWKFWQTGNYRQQESNSHR